MQRQIDMSLSLPVASQFVAGGEVCTLLNISRTTLWRLRAQGLPATKVRGHLRYKLEEVEQWLTRDAATTAMGPRGRDKAGKQEAVSEEMPPCHWKVSVALDPKHRPQTPDRPSTTVRREWWRFPQEAHLLDLCGHRFRRLLAEEVAVLQGFPSDWGRASGLSELDLIRGYGNAVPPPLAEVLIRQLAKSVPGGIRTGVEICAGVGGLALGAAQASRTGDSGLEIEHLALIDMWSPAIEVLRVAGAWSRDRVFCADVTQFDWSPLVDRVDLLSGGPPCQPWSQGGTGLGTRDDRDLLGFMPELLRTVRPKAFLFENVPGLLRGENASYAKKLIDDLRGGSEYGVAVGELCAADFGVPQVRRRVFIVGIRGARDVDLHAYFDAVANRRTHTNPREPMAAGRIPWVTVGEALHGWRDVRLGWRRWIDIPKVEILDDATSMSDKTAASRVRGHKDENVDNLPKGIGLWWPGRMRRPMLVNGQWVVSNDPDDATLSTLPLLGHSANGRPDRDPWYLRGDPIATLDALRRTLSRQVELLYLDAPRLRTDAAAFEAADGQAALNTWLTLMHAILRRSVRFLAEDGVVVVLAGLVESPYVQTLLTELLGPKNYVGTIAWQKGYAPQNMPNLREFYYTHDNLIVFAKRREEGLPRVALRVLPEGYQNPDNDPRLAWKAEQKGANKPDCDYSVNLPPYRWKIVGNLPPGVWRVNAKSGVIWGAELPRLGLWRFTVEVTDKAGTSVRKPFEIKVMADGPAPIPVPPPWLIANGSNGPTPGGDLAITSATLPEGRVGAPYYACLQATGGEPWVGSTRPGKNSISGTGRYWDYPAKTLVAAATEDRLDFKASDDAIPAIKNYLHGATESALNQVTTWLGGAGVDTAGARLVKEKDPLKIGYGQDAKKELEALMAAKITDRVVTISKPSGLISRLLALFSRENGVVLDLGSPAAEMASLATVLRRTAVYVEFPGDEEAGNGLRLARLRHASKGLHPLPNGVLFAKGPNSAPDGRGFFVGESPRAVDTSADVCEFRPGAPFAAVSPSDGVVLIDYSAYRPKTRSFLEALASLEGLVPTSACDVDYFAHSWNGSTVASYVAGEIFLDEAVIERLRVIHSEHLALAGTRLRIYYHRGFEDSVQQGDPHIELRRVPFNLQIAVGAL